MSMVSIALKAVRAVELVSSVMFIRLKAVLAVCELEFVMNSRDCLRWGVYHFSLS